MIRSIVVLLVAMFGVAAVFAYTEQEILDTCTKHVVSDKTFGKYLDRPKKDSRYFRFYTNATDRIQFALNVAPLFPHKEINDVIDTFTFDITMNQIVVESRATTITVETDPILLENKVNEIAVHSFFDGVVRIYVNGFKYSVKAGNPKNNKTIGFSININGNKHIIRGPHKETEISFQSVSFAVSSQPQAFYLDCGLHETQAWDMDKAWDNEE